MGDGVGGGVGNITNDPVNTKVREKGGQKLL